MIGDVLQVHTKAFCLKLSSRLSQPLAGSHTEHLSHGDARSPSLPFSPPPPLLAELTDLSPRREKIRAAGGGIVCETAFVCLLLFETGFSSEIIRKHESRRRRALLRTMGDVPPTCAWREVSFDFEHHWTMKYAVRCTEPAAFPTKERPSAVAGESLKKSESAT